MQQGNPRGSGSAMKADLPSRGLGREVREGGSEGLCPQLKTITFHRLPSFLPSPIPLVFIGCSLCALAV